MPPAGKIRERNLHAYHSVEEILSVRGIDGDIKEDRG